MATGKVKWFNDSKGWGFIETDGGGDCFVHHRDILAASGEHRTLENGERVEFDIAKGDKGNKATKVRRLGVER